MADSAPTAEDLLAHTEWLTRLARALVGDGAAGDVVQDTYEAALEKLIRSKKSGKKIKKPAKQEGEPKPSNVVNLFDALKKSLGSDDKDKAAGTGTGAGKKPAKRRTTSKTKSG